MSSATDKGTKPSDGIFAAQSSLYHEFLAEREEILKHKWIESQKKGKDIGFERALLDWVCKYRDQWKAERRDARNQTAKAPNTKGGSLSETA